MKTQHKIIFAIVTFVLLILIEIPFYLTPSQPQPQAYNARKGWRVVISLFLKGGGNTPNLLVIAIYLACFKQKHRAALHVLLYQCQLFLTFTMRSFYKMPRPYMQWWVYCPGAQDCTKADDAEQPYSCKGSFGSPSFHALSCTSITMYLLLDFIITRDEIAKVIRYQADDSGSLVQLPPLHTVRITRVSAALILLAGLVYTFLTGILQWKLEVSYLNQLTFGWLLGLWLAFVFAFIIRGPFYIYFKALLEERQEISLLRKHIYVVAAITGGMMLVCMIEYFAVRNEVSDQIYGYQGSDGVFVDGYVQHLVPLMKWCSGLDTNLYKKETFFFGVDVEYSSAFICILTGYLGMIYQRIYFKGQLFIEVYPFDSQVKKFARFLGRFVVMSILAGTIFWLISHILPIIQQKPIGIWEIYFVGILIPYGVGAFLAFAFGDWVCLKLKLYKDNEVYGLEASMSISSPQFQNLNETRNTTFGTGTSDSEHFKAMKSSGGQSLYFNTAQSSSQF